VAISFKLIFFLFEKEGGRLAHWCFRGDGEYGANNPYPCVYSPEDLQCQREMVAYFRWKEFVLILLVVIRVDDAHEDEVEEERA
jgi:hypothetical protein